MTTFDKREKAFEGKFAHDEQQSFEIEAKCVKIFGLWVAQEIGLNASDAETYASQLVQKNLDEPGLNNVLRMAHDELSAKNIETTEHALHIALDKALAEAKSSHMEG